VIEGSGREQGGASVGGTEEVSEAQKKRKVCKKKNIYPEKKNHWTKSRKMAASQIKKNAN